MTISSFASLPAAKQDLILMACQAAGFDFRNECLEHDAAKPTESRWMRLEEAAAVAGVSTFTVRRWATAGKVEFRKLNRARCGRILILRESLYRFIEVTCKKNTNKKEVHHEHSY